MAFTRLRLVMIMVVGVLGVLAWPTIDHAITKRDMTRFGRRCYGVGWAAGAVTSDSNSPSANRVRIFDFARTALTV